MTDEQLMAAMDADATQEIIKAVFNDPEQLKALQRECKKVGLVVELTEDGDGVVISRCTPTDPAAAALMTALADPGLSEMN